MLIPIGHEEDSVRRLPWITFGIMIICTVMLVGTIAFQPEMSEAYDAVDEAIGYWMEHPYLEMDPKLEGMVWGEVTEEEREEFRAMWGDQFPPPSSHEQQEAEQAELDRLCLEALSSTESDPHRRFGLVPSSQTAAFFHGDEFHGAKHVAHKCAVPHFAIFIGF